MCKLSLFLITTFIFSPLFVSAQIACTAETLGKTRAQLEAELAACNAEIAKWQETLTKTRAENASFSRDIAALTAKINAAQANIKAKNIAVTNLSKDIAKKESQITVLNNRIIKGRLAVAEILRKTNEITSNSLAEVLLSNKGFSEFFLDIDTYTSTEKALEQLFAELKSAKALTEAEKLDLAKKRDAEAAARAAMEAAKKEVEKNQSEKKVLLAINKSREKSYEQVLAEKQAKAAQIRAVLFPLRDAGPIPFGTALQYAQSASAKTGVRAAFILGIFATESGKGADGTFGRNVGQCILTNSPNKGDGKGKNTGTPFAGVMRADSRRDDVTPFIEIVTQLGLDPFTQPVSCPQTGGYGGAMGPAQFIASTWKLMKERISAATGKAVPNPWDPADAFMAAALYLADLGAASGNERSAACRYNGGGSGCTSRTSGYGNSVMSNATRIQQDIDFLQSI